MTLEHKENMTARIELESVREKITVLLHGVQDAMEDPELDNSFNHGMACAYFILQGVLDLRIESVRFDSSVAEDRLAFEVVRKARGL